MLSIGLESVVSRAILCLKPALWFARLMDEMSGDYQVKKAEPRFRGF
jgi:hypothetical protein